MDQEVYPTLATPSTSALCALCAHHSTARSLRRGGPARSGADSAPIGLPLRADGICAFARAGPGRAASRAARPPCAPGRSGRARGELLARCPYFRPARLRATRRAATAPPAPPTPRQQPRSGRPRRMTAPTCSPSDCRVCAASGARGPRLVSDRPGVERLRALFEAVAVKQPCSCAPVPAFWSRSCRLRRLWNLRDLPDLALGPGPLERVAQPRVWLVPGWPGASTSSGCARRSRPRAPRRALACRRGTWRRGAGHARRCRPSARPAGAGGTCSRPARACACTACHRASEQRSGPDRASAGLSCSRSRTPGGGGTIRRRALRTPPVLDETPPSWMAHFLCDSGASNARGELPRAMIDPAPVLSRQSLA